MDFRSKWSWTGVGSCSGRLRRSQCGAPTPHRFYDAARQLVNLAIDANDNGDYFPVSVTEGGGGGRGGGGGGRGGVYSDPSPPYLMTENNGGYFPVRVTEGGGGMGGWGG